MEVKKIKILNIIIVLHQGSMTICAEKKENYLKTKMLKRVREHRKRTSHNITKIQKNAYFLNKNKIYCKKLN